MRIRKVWSNTKAHCDNHSLAAPTDVSSAAQSPPPWLQILQHSPPIMISRVNVSVCSNQNTVIASSEEGTGSSTEEKSLHGDKCSSSISTKTSAASSASSSLSRHGRWCEEEKAFPVKKRRLSLERFITQESEHKNKKAKTKAIFRRSASKIKHEKEREYKYNEVDDEMKMGSLRCSGRNGLGWRCKRNQKVKGSGWCDDPIRGGKHPSASPNAFIGESDECYGRKGCGVGKKKTRIRRISSILSRTMPLLANANGNIQI
ncbi:uncharacterized protein LOC8260975 isoform X2 [Ricinus communis]|uniref:uncharacterized protein LOC8260975 isoform X2 n=1 Tax=Ricinus communis TaxID=3988 RepID=UPI0007723F04|nr:uncharacterized protein LOC8260975 isoform X2 [Ricinus communis]|eukprot:XP_015583956.1 uncharacterized protein LOC8260975 isoform X2 [Ricinus communis]